VLHCNGKMDEMRQVAAEAPELSGDAARRSAAAFAARRKPAAIDLDAARREFAAMLNQQIA
jgi:beta-N-acetylhexosaminidase